MIGKRIREFLGDKQVFYLVLSLATAMANEFNGGNQMHAVHRGRSVHERSTAPRFDGEEIVLSLDAAGAESSRVRL
jgi:hypothetical protein